MCYINNFLLELELWRQARSIYAMENKLTPPPLLSLYNSHSAFKPGKQQAYLFHLARLSSLRFNGILKFVFSCRYTLQPSFHFLFMNFFKVSLLFFHLVYSLQVQIIIVPLSWSHKTYLSLTLSPSQLYTLIFTVRWVLLFCVGQKPPPSYSLCSALGSTHTWNSHVRTIPHTS